MSYLRGCAYFELRTVRIALCALVAISGFGQPNQSSNSLESRRVSLMVRSESWVAGSSFDRQGFEQLCTAAKVSIVSDSKVDGIIAIDYRETVGSTYIGGGRGTNIAFTLSLISPTDGQSVIALKSTADTPSSVRIGRSLHDAARDVLTASSVYRMSCNAVAAALGSRAAAERLLPWAASEREGLRVVEAVHFIAKSPREEAYLAVAKRQFTGLPQLGAVALEPLVSFIKSRYQPSPDGHSCHPPDGDLSSVGAAAAALAEIGGQGSVKVLEDLLKSCLTFISDAVEPAVVPALAGLGKVGNVFSLNVLEEWAARKDKQGGVTDISTTPANRRVGEAATNAANAIRARIAKAR
ncbi:MAG: hypothetical protein HY820_42250 [Acidobacteria bacterium]|nr:hypothetical protein [Acidobacteriota bacterium]